MAFYSKTVLDNGIKVISERMDIVRSVSLGIWIGAGSRDEPAPINGASHFLEHMMFKGTPARTSRQISEAFESLGAELNAFTTKEATAYYFRILDEHFAVGLEILADMLQNSLFDETDIKAEKQVVLEEISLHEDSPDELVHDLFSDSVYNHHPLGKRILGTNKSVHSFNRKNIVEFYKSTYIPSNMVVAAAGNIEHSQLVDLANRLFKSKSGRIFDRHKQTPAKEQSRLIVMDKPTEQAHLCLGTLALAAKDKDRFVLSVMDNVLGGGMSSRLFWEIREKRGLAYSVYSYHSVHTETGSFCMYAGTNPKSAGEVIKVMQHEIEKITSKKVSGKELYRAKQHIKGQLVLGLESTNHRMMRLGKSELAQGKIYSVDELIKKIDAVSAEDIKQLANTLLAKDRLNLSVIGPFKAANFANLDYKTVTNL